jgi:hypothetical protein
MKMYGVSVGTSRRSWDLLIIVYLSKVGFDSYTAAVLGLLGESSGHGLESN